MIKTRFAPSPTGTLHIGNIRTALLNWMFARQQGGLFLLRLDDTDAERSTQAFADAIIADLGWLGLKPDDQVRQSDRFALYQKRFDELRDKGRVYPCYESSQELDLKRKVLLGRGLPPIYDRAALQLTDADRAALEASGIAPHWRFKLDQSTPLIFDDLIRGSQRFDPALLSDPVIRRGDGSWLYMLPSVIDDVDMGITHVVRGEDHVTNTALQLQMFEALDAPAPRFAHAALLTGEEGKLSKRLGSLGVDHFRDTGIEALAVKALLARIGTSDPVIPVADMTALNESFNFAHFGRAPARFDETELAAINARILHLLPFEAVSGRLPEGMDAQAWAAIRPNISTLGDVGIWWSLVRHAPANPNIDPEDRAYLADAADIAATLDWASDPWHGLTSRLKDNSGRKGKALFLPLRRALTGLDHGPDMAALLPLIDQQDAVARLRNNSAA
ncbi:glutamate--tRNA ligase [Aquisediminimonas sediminicola]|uniref:glutamate--tRNA ligase n=1 Tax=Alteraquisediminimonas sediminicola TaxID=2676787 RepID=UPI001C8D554A|nr:glutamate--tRNA ligase [Aquisediminimonas sediminicola]